MATPPWNGKPVYPMLPIPHSDSSYSCFPDPLFVSIFTLRAFPHERIQIELPQQNQRTNFVKFQSRQISSAPDLFIRPASIVAKGFHLQFPGFIQSRVKIPEFCNKRQFLPF